VVGAASSTAAADATASADPGSSATPPERGDATPGYPYAASCSLDSTGLAPGRSRQCQFTATSAGGWAFSSYGGAGFDVPEAALTVTHGGKSTTYRTGYGVTCSDAVIVRGDRVQLTLTAPSADVEPVYRAGAGRGWSCAGQG
jgi:hypothetical protein